MPTFGKTTPGGSSAKRSDGLYSRFTVPENGTLTDIAVFLQLPESATQANVAIYAHDTDTGKPGALLAQGTPKSISLDDANTWLVFSGFSLALTGGDTVWLAARGNANIRFTWDGGTQIVDDNTTGTATFPDPYTNGSSSWALDMAIYATYTAGGGGPTYDETGRALTIAGQESLTDRQNYKDALALAVISGQTVRDLAAWREALFTQMVSAEGLSDRQHYADNVLATLATATTISDRQGYLDLLSVLASALVTETDSLNGALLETLTLNIVSQGSLRDVQNYLDTIGFTVQGLTTALDRQDYTETLAILAAGVEGLSDRQHYIDRANRYEIEAQGKNSGYILPALPTQSWEISFLLFIPKEVSANRQSIFDIKTMLLSVMGQDITLSPGGSSITISGVKEQWNSVVFSFDGNNTYELKVNSQVLTTVYANSGGEQGYFLYSPGGTNPDNTTFPPGNFFGDPGYKVAAVRGAYHFGNTWQDSAKSIPALNGDSVDTIENHGDSTSGDITLTSGFTPGIRRDGAPVFGKVSGTLTDIQAYIDALSITATATVKITESYLGAILEALGFTITSTETIADAQGYVERIGIAATAGTGEADAQHFADSLGLTMQATVTVSDLAALAERLNVIATAVITGVDRQSIREMLSDLWTSLIAVSDAYTPRDLPRVVFEFFYSRERSIKQSRRNRHFEQAEKGRHVKYDK